MTNNYNIEYDLCKIDVVKFERLKGKIKETESIPVTSSFDMNSSIGSFQLKLEDSRKLFSKSRMKVQCEGEEIDYIIFKYGSDIEFAKEVKE